MIRPPSSRLGPATEAERKTVMKRSPVAGDYDEAIDRKSAYEVLMEKRKIMAAEQEKAAAKTAKAKAKKKPAKRGRKRQSALEAGTKAAVRSIGNQIGRKLGGKHGAAIVRGILGSMMRR